MFLTKRSWPGTSTIPMGRPSGSSRSAKPRSMVMPRAFSSGSRSVSMPVSALTSEVLPWSMWPAVPTTTCVDADARLSRSASAAQVRPRRGSRGPAVEEEAIVHDAAEHRRRRRRAAPRRAHGRRRVCVPRASAAVGSSTVGKRAAADLRARLDDLRARARVAPPGQTAQHAPARRAPDARQRLGEHRGAWASSERRSRLVGVERRLERGDRELVDAQRAVERVLLQALHQARAAATTMPA